MSSLAFAVRDSGTMLRRNLRHMLRYPSLTFMLAALPIIFLLLFAFVFGGTLGAGLGGDRTDYLAFVVPGVLMLSLGGQATGTALSVATDLQQGIVARFRTMAIARVSILTGHVLGSMVQTYIGLAIVLAAALAVGYRPTASPLAWLGLIGVVAMISFAFIWLAVALGMVARTVEEASNTPLPLTLLPFLGSGFVPTDTMPAGLRQFAEHQPYTPFTETVRALLAGHSPAGSDLLWTAAWCAVLALGGYLWSRHRYNKL
ncbi:ABC transporter permease [Actinoplanes sp. N902-109]|uniref:ABC transporter permease n=1 Tax=Actinoplanes sp. (strain N902-109) TaxID=649831 RepID=UPI00032963FD|nr:ABC transporter permease [Actinoplanes sp. N902-109]AGL17777.1 ABC-2 type transporter [Actinoplanes sp. N902-109]